MKAGLLTERLTIEMYVESQSESGFVKKEYKPIATLRAYKRKKSFNEKIQAFEDITSGSAVFQMRKNPYTKEGNFVTHDGKRYKIIDVEGNSDSTITITCKRIDE